MPVDRLAQVPDIEHALPQVMAGHETMSLREAVAGLRAAGLRLPSSAFDAEELVCEAAEAFKALVTLGDDDRLINLAQVMDGRTLAHRLTAQEVADDVLAVENDFPGAAFDHLSATGLLLPDGRRVTLQVGTKETGLGFRIGPATWADLGRSVGDLVGVTFSGGTALLVSLDEVGAAEAGLVEDLRSSIQDSAQQVGIDVLGDDVLIGSSHFRSPVPPITEILADNGFATSGDLVAASAEALAASERDLLAKGLASRFELAPAEARAVAGAVHVVRILDDALSGAGAPDLAVADSAVIADAITDAHAHADADADADSEAHADPDAESDAARPLAEIEVWLAQRMARVQRQMSEADVSLLQIRADLRDPWLAEVTAMSALDRRDPHPDGLELLVEQLAGSKAAPPSRAERASLEYLRGRCHEFAGDPLAAEGCFQRAVSLVPDHAAALLSMAALAADRGAVEVASSLLERSGAPSDHPLRGAIEASSVSQSAPARQPGRNEPCWCGSGRKFKACHARVSTTPLPDRARFILSRAVAWLAVSDPDALSALMVLASRLGAPVRDLAPLMVDSLLFEGGGLADYLERRGPLLAADEVLLAGQWLLRPRSLFDVEDARPGQGLTLRDVVTGERCDVVERTASREVGAGTLLLTRVAPIGQENQIFGGAFPIPLHERDQLLAILIDQPTPVDLVTFLAGRWRRPQIVTHEGDALTPVMGTFTVRAPKQLRIALDGSLTRMGEGEWSLMEEASAGSTRSLASLRLAGRTLEVEAMSEARYERVLGILDALDTELVEKSREVADPSSMVPGEPRGRDAAGTSPPGPGPLGPGALGLGAVGARARDPRALDPRTLGPRVLDPHSLDPSEYPEIAAAVTALIAEHERSWLDESIPALGGVTPRQAAADPTRRDDLIRLLDTFPSEGLSTQMDGGRLKVALGL